MTLLIKFDGFAVSQRRKFVNFYAIKFDCGSTLSRRAAGPYERAIMSRRVAPRRAAGPCKWALRLRPHA